METMEEPTEGVTDETTNDVIVEQEQAQTEQPNVEVKEPEQPTSDVTAEAKERDDFWKNRAMEMERKNQNLVDNLPNYIEEALKKNNKPQESEYTIEQLEAFAQSSPENKPWVEAKKAEILEKRLTQTVSSLINKEKEVQQAEFKKREALNQVINDPKYAEAFSVDALGNKVWNTGSKMAQLIGYYLQQPELVNRPDGVALAAKLARAEVLDSQISDGTKKLSTLKRQNEKLKSKTLVEGSGVPAQSKAKDPYQEAAERARQTGRVDDTQKAVAEYLKRRNSRNA